MTKNCPPVEVFPKAFQSLGLLGKLLQFKGSKGISDFGGVSGGKKSAILCSSSNDQNFGDGRGGLKRERESRDIWRERESRDIWRERERKKEREKEREREREAERERYREREKQRKREQRERERERESREI